MKSSLILTEQELAVFYRVMWLDKHRSNVIGPDARVDAALALLRVMLEQRLGLDWQALCLEHIAQTENKP